MRLVGKFVRFRIPAETYALIEEKIRKHRTHGVYFMHETMYRIFMTGIETLGVDGIEKLIVDIKTRKEQQWKGGGGARDD
jgi:hypothetical protein